MNEGSPPLHLNTVETKFVLRRLLFLFLGWVATVGLSEIVPFIKDLNQSWSGIAVIALTGLFELLAKIAANGTKTKFLSLLFIPLLSMNCYGQILKDFPKEVEPYKLIKLEATEGTSWAWIIKRLPDGFRPETYINTNQCIWVGPPGTYDIDVISIQDGALKQQYSQLVIKSTDVSPNPNPGPTPNPNPNPGPTPNPGPSPNPGPVPPSDKYEIGRWIHERASTLPAGPRSFSQKLSDNFEAIAAGIAAGQFQQGGVQAAQKELAARNRDILVNESYDAWKPIFESLGEKTKELKVPTTLSSYAEYYRFISTGLKYVPK
jgi:hypothetical protein